MNVVEAALRRVAADLDRHGRRWALVGGFAVSARAEPRFTRDVDVAVAVPDDDAAEALVRLFASSGIEAEIVEAAELIEILPGLAVMAALQDLVHRIGR